jgi:deazaflavin-dependent oxidoreductase (nitroreductase family)
MTGQVTVSPWLRSVLRLPDVLYRHGLGRLLGQRFLRLVHIGRRTGRSHATVLEVVRHDRHRSEFTVVSGFGTRADWLRNIDAGTPAEVTVGRHAFAADHRRLDREEAFAVMAEYERRHRAARPLLHRVLSWLLGWGYDGSDAARWRLVEQLPLVALRPRTEVDPARPDLRARNEGPRGRLG